ncbi:MAG TPA: flagellar hook-basal body complex protein FliE [Nevskiaceae bacterium]|nr:flagellar hook-basal body complex protein FliE [Nevskiaceae bacterium]
MAPVNVNQLLSQLRSLAAQADASVPQAGKSLGPQPATSGFGEVLTHALDSVNQSQLSARKAADNFAMGRGDLPTAMLAASRAQVQFQAAVEVRNRMVQAYQQIMQMTV